MTDTDDTDEKDTGAFAKPFRFYEGMENAEAFKAAYAAWSDAREYGDVNCQGAFRKGWIAAEAAMKAKANV